MITDAIASSWSDSLKGEQEERWSAVSTIENGISAATDASKEPRVGGRGSTGGGITDQRGIVHIEREKGESC